MKKSNLITLILSLILAACTGTKCSKKNKLANETETFLSEKTKEGLYHYEDVSASDESKIDTILNHYQNIDLENRDSTFLKIYYLNLYELMFIKQIASHQPIAYITDVKDFFTKKIFTIDAKSYSMNSLRKQKIKPLFSNPSYLLLIPYGGYSDHCFDGKPFVQQEFNEQTKSKLIRILSDNKFIRIKPASELILIPELFLWFKEEFGDTSQVRQYINKHREELPNNYKIEYYPWSWKVKL